MFLTLKRQCHKIYCFRFFSRIIFPKPLKITLGSFQIFFYIKFEIAIQGVRVPPLSTTPSVNLSLVPLVSVILVANWHRWHLMVTISESLQLKVNLKKKIIYMLTLPLYVNFSDWRFPFLCQWQRWCTLSCDYLRKFKKKIWNGPNSILRGLEETYSWKTLKSKISWHSPFKGKQELEVFWLRF